MVALKANGEVWIWGDDLTSRDQNRKARRVPDVEKAIDIVAGNEFGCALLADHNIRCFGPRVDRNVTKPRGPYGLNSSGRPVYEDKQTWIDAPLYEIWNDAPTQ